jgi:hypothetical protein
MPTPRSPKRPQEPPGQLILEGLTTLEDARLGPGADYESVLFADLRFTGQVA